MKSDENTQQVEPAIETSFSTAELTAQLEVSIQISENDFHREYHKLDSKIESIVNPLGWGVVYLSYIDSNTISANLITIDCVKLPDLIGHE